MIWNYWRDFLTEYGLNIHIALLSLHFFSWKILFVCFFLKLIWNCNKKAVVLRAIKFKWITTYCSWQKYKYINLQMLYRHLHHHNDTIIKMQENFFINICTSHFIVRVRKGLLKVCVWEGVGDRTETAIFWPPLLWPSTLCLSRSPGLLNQRPREQLCWVICYILSATSLHPNSIGGPESLRPGVAFFTTSHL